MFYRLPPAEGGVVFITQNKTKQKNTETKLGEQRGFIWVWSRLDALDRIVLTLETSPEGSWTRPGFHLWADKGVKKIQHKSRLMETRFTRHNGAIYSSITVVITSDEDRLRQRAHWLDRTPAQMDWLVWDSSQRSRY